MEGMRMGGSEGVRMRKGGGEREAEDILSEEVSGRSKRIGKPRGALTNARSGASYGARSV